MASCSCFVDIHGSLIRPEDFVSAAYPSLFRIAAAAALFAAPVATPLAAQSPDAIPASVQQELAAAQQGLFAQAQIAVQEALRAQAPIIGAEAAMRSAKWHKKR